MKKTRFLITGSTGFVGRYVIRELPAEYSQIRLVVRKGKENEAIAMRGDAEISLTEDLFVESEEWWRLQCKDIDTIIHLAWHVEAGEYLSSPKNVDCLIGSLNLLKAAAAEGVKRFIGIGTCFEYNITKTALTIDTPLNPQTLYGATKAALYLTLRHVASESTLEFAWCRLFYLYGEGEDPRRFVAYIRDKLERGETVALTHGEQVRDYLNIVDAAKIIAKIASGDQTGAINVCSGVARTIKQFAEQIADEYDGRGLLLFGERKENVTEPQFVLGVPNIVTEDN